MIIKPNINIMKKLALLTGLWLFSLSLTAQEEARLMRFPAIHGNQIAFSYAGDLYIVETPWWYGP
jgi:tricorn protease